MSLGGEASNVLRRSAHAKSSLHTSSTTSGSPTASRESDPSSALAENGNSPRPVDADAETWKAREVP